MIIIKFSVKSYCYNQWMEEKNRSEDHFYSQSVKSYVTILIIDVFILILLWRDSVGVSFTISNQFDVDLFS